MLENGDKVRILNGPRLVRGRSGAVAGMQNGVLKVRLDEPVGRSEPLAKLFVFDGFSREDLEKIQ